MFLFRKNYHLLIVLFFASLFFAGCLNSNKNAESANDSEKQTVSSAIKKSLYEQILDIGGDKLPKGSSDYWENMKNMIEELDKLIEERGSNKIRKRAVNKIFKKYGYEKYEEGYAAVEECSEKINFILNIGLKVASLETIELTKTKDDVNNTQKEIITELQKAGYSQSDVEYLDKYEEVLGKSVSLLVKLPTP